MDPATFSPLRQNGDEWGGDQLGDPMSNGKILKIGAAGCLLTSLCMILNYIKGTKLTPDKLNDELRDAKCFSGPLLIVEKAAAHLGLVAPDSVRYRTTTADQSADSVSRAINNAFDQGKLVILHVDINSQDPGGDIYGDHFVAGFDRVGGYVRCGDPAPGSIFNIDTSTTIGESTWIPARDVADLKNPGKTEHLPAVVKTARVVGVIPIWEAAA